MPATLRSADSPVTGINGFPAFTAILSCLSIKEKKIHYASQVKLLLAAMAPQEDDLECLGEGNGDAIWKRWVDKQLWAKSKAPGTLISHLTSLQLFLTYITRRKCGTNLMPPLSPDLKVTFAQLIAALQGWRACIDSFSQHSQLRKINAECDALITSEDIQNLHTSKPCVEGARIIHKAEKGAQLSFR